MFTLEKMILLVVFLKFGFDLLAMVLAMRSERLLALAHKFGWPINSFWVHTVFWVLLPLTAVVGYCLFMGKALSVELALIIAVTGFGWAITTLMKSTVRSIAVWADVVSWLAIGVGAVVSAL